MTVFTSIGPIRRLHVASLCALLAPTPSWCTSAATPVGPAASMSERQAAHEIAAESREQLRLLAVLHADIAQIPEDDPRRAEKVRLLAAIEKRIADEERQFSRRRYMSGVVQDDPVFHGYCLAMRRRIEERGTDHFPMRDGHKLYGRVVANLTVDASGRLVGSELVRGSGDKTLDAQALGIAARAAPFGAFTPAMHKEADKIVYAASFNFRRGNASSASQAASMP